MEDVEEPWQSKVLSRRHITHNRSKSSRTSGKNSGHLFDPKHTYGTYSISCPALAKQILKSKPGLITADIASDADAGPLSAALSAIALSSPNGLVAGQEWSGSPVTASPGGGGDVLGRKKSKRGKGVGGGNTRRGSKEDRFPAQGKGQGLTDATFEIHSLVPGDGNEGSLQCSFNLSDIIHGVAVLAGSRKLLARVIADLEGEDSPDELEVESVASTVDYDDSEDEEEIIDEIEEADERERRKIAAFEKNSFRAPKFWMKWRGWVSSEGTIGARGGDGAELQRSKSGRLVEINTAYVVFSGNDCAKFNGTFNCQALGWKNVKISGVKVVGKARACPLEWTDVVADVVAGKR